MACGRERATSGTVDRLHRADSLKQIREMFESPDERAGAAAPLHAAAGQRPLSVWAKFVVQESLVARVLFAVDAHDELKVTPDMADFEQWMELRRHNQDLKQRIEASWRRRGLPTYGDLRKLPRASRAAKGRPPARAHPAGG
ncbi:MAG: hypothetical protein R3F17_06420 [Planctomycetota bacterium]